MADALKSKAITSELTERMFGDELKHKNIVYYLTFRLMVETDIPFKELTHLKVSDISGKTELSYTTHSGGSRTMPLSDGLQKEVNDYIAASQKKETDYLLTGRNNGNPLHTMTISQVFASVSKMLKIDPPVSIRSCHKTFIYHMLISDGSSSRARNYLHANSEKEIYEYIGVPAPDRKGKSPVVTKADLAYSNLIEAVSDKVNATLYSVERLLKSDTDLSPEECSAIKDFCEKLDSAVTEYRIRRDG